MLDFERMDATKEARVSRRIHEYILRRTCSPGAIIFCLEMVPLEDPVLLYIRKWIDEDECIDEEECEDAATFLAKVCRVCNLKDGVKACARCERVYYCSKNCQVSDWKRHKLTCKRGCTEWCSVAFAT